MKSLASLALLLTAPAFGQQPPPTDKPSGSSEAAPGERRFDTVDYAVVGEGAGYRAAVRGLTAGSYAEVTALDGGKTVLVTIDESGAAEFATLSPAAAAALGIAGRAAVRVRRVTPTPQDIVALRNGEAASERLASPPALLNALRNRLPASPRSAPVKVVAKPTPKPVPTATPKPTPTPTPVAKPVAPAPKPAPVVQGRFIVQVAALSNAASAQALARKLGGSVSPSGKLHRVRLGPFADRASAEKARAKAAAAGYRDSTIQTN